MSLADFVLSAAGKLKDDFLRLNTYFTSIKTNITSLEVKDASLQTQITNLSFTGSEHDALVTSALEDIENEDFNSVGKGYLNGRLDKWETKIKNSLNSVFDVMDYGAKGDGITNDTDAFKLACTALEANGGGILNIPNATYIVGKQTFAGQSGLDYSYNPDSIISIQDCDSVIIQGNGSTLKADDNLRFGSFDPITGNVYNPSMPFVDLDYRADAYYGMIYLDSNNMAVVRDLELDGNQANIVLGGEWGDVGRQCAGNGLRCYDNNTLLLENIYSHHHPLDGITIKTLNAIDTDLKTNQLMINCTCEYNSRQGLSWIGGIGLMGINCKFNHTGKARFSSSPASGFDAEAENAVIRKGLFINCECVNNAGMGFVADSGDTEDITFRDCTFWGTTNYAIWGNKPKLKFHDCIIYGAVTNLYDGVSWDDGVQFHNCHFEDKSHPTYGVYTSNDAFLFLGYAYNQFYNCKIVANESKFLYTITPTSPKLFQNCEFINKYDALTSGAWNSSMAGCIFRNCTIRDVVTTTDKYWYVRDELRNVIDGLNIVTPYTLWYYPTITNIGYIPNNEQIKMEKISIKSATGNDYTSSNEIYYRSSVPTTSEESYKKGDVIFNYNPVIGGKSGWICMSSGTLGTLGAITGTIVTSSSKLTVNSVTGLSVGMFISIAGVSGTKMIIYINGLVLTLNAASNASVTDAAVTYITPTFSEFGNINLQGSATLDPVSLADGVGETSSAITVAGAELGDFVLVSAPYDLQGITCNAYVSATDTVKIRLQNETTGTIDLASGTWRVKVIKS